MELTDRNIYTNQWQFLITSAVTDKASNLPYLIMLGCTIPCYIYFLIILFNRKNKDSSNNATVATI